MSSRYDIAVIGAGHNGLVAAAYLARAGKRVVVLERRSVLGGLAATEELWPGYHVDTGWWDADLLADEVIDDLQLKRHGLEFIASPASALTPTADGSALTLWRDPEQTRAEIARVSPVDANHFDGFVARLTRLASIVRATRTLAPPDLAVRRLRDVVSWGRVGLAARRLGRRDLMELLRILPLPARQLLDEAFASDALKVLLGANSVTGMLLGPYEVGTTFMLLYQGLVTTRGRRYVRGGVGRLSTAIAAAATAAGASIRTDCAVARVVVKHDRAEAVVLADGQSIDAAVVVSSADPKHTLFDLVGADRLPIGVVKKVRNVRLRGALARVFLGLRELPPRLLGLAADDLRLTGRIVLAPSLEAIERAYDVAKYGELPIRPMLEVRIPTLLDPALAPPGKHIMLIQLHYVPYRHEHDDDAARAAVATIALALLDEVAPRLSGCVEHCAVLLPIDLERVYGTTGGDVYHGQMALDQLLHMRPTGGQARYQTAVDGLWLAGAGCHPGGGVTGAPGYNTARAILQTR